LTLCLHPLFGASLTHSPVTPGSSG
jgi:hypothetical protein